MKRIELYIGINTLVEVEVSRLVTADNSPTAYFWELWNGSAGRNKRELKAAGLSPRKEGSRWVVGGTPAAAPEVPASSLSSPERVRELYRKAMSL